jgi:SAM-dependent methyltransferase
MTQLAAVSPSDDVPVAKRARFQAIRLLRRFNLLRAADECRFLVRKLRVASANRSFLARHPGFRPPPQDLAFDAYNHFDWQVYWDSGLAHAGYFAERILEHARPGKVDVLEWGCGPGRLIRHLPSLLGERAGRIAGADYNERTIAWCRSSLDGIDFELNGLMPPLPFPDASFDVVYNFSVFTHLSAPVQKAWAKELHRVLRPGGIALCTTHGDAYAHLLSDPAERAAYAAGQVVEQGGYKEGAKWYFAVHPPAWVRGELFRDFASATLLPSASDRGLLQDAWLARKAG